jgi:hypothetical protein
LYHTYTRTWLCLVENTDDSELQIANLLNGKLDPAELKKILLKLGKIIAL